MLGGGCTLIEIKIFQPNFDTILCSNAGFLQIPLFLLPLTQASVIEHFKAFINYRGNNIVTQAFLQHQQSAHSAVAVLKRMYTLKSIMKIYCTISSAKNQSKIYINSNDLADKLPQFDIFYKQMF